MASVRLFARDADGPQYHGIDRDATAQSPSVPVEAPTGSSGSTTVYLGIGIGVGVVLMIAIVSMVMLVARKRRQHRQILASSGGNIERGMVQDMVIGDVPRPVSEVRVGSLVPMLAQAGWGALSSDESVHQVQKRTGFGKKGKPVVLLPKRLKQRGIPLSRMKHLSAIVESPRSKSARSSTIAAQESSATGPNLLHPAFRQIQPPDDFAVSDDKDAFTAPGSPKTNILPSFALRSPRGLAITITGKPRASRSISVGAVVSDRTSLGSGPGATRPSLHARSVSLGAPLTRPPSGPVPPLPIDATTGASDDTNTNRRGLFVRRVSTDSSGSASSSVLVTSPLMTLFDDKDSKPSSSVEQLIPESKSAQLKTVVNRQWQNPLITGPRPGLNASALASHGRDTSIRSNMAQYSSQHDKDSSALRRNSSANSASSTSSGAKRLSRYEVATADRMSFSRVSSSSSLKSTGPVKKIATPRRISRNLSVTVSENGSPAERKRDPVLGDLSGNATTPSRQASFTTQGSARSSNGDPFHWDQDQPMAKPSALKGSPNARKGHRRQNCVRISTLTPQVLGPPPCRPLSSSIMHGIIEESVDDETVHDTLGRRFVTNTRMPRPTSNTSLTNSLRVQTLRASLTPSSPTLSAYTAYQEGGLTSHPSDGQLSVSPSARSKSRHSDCSLMSVVPRFPSPGKSSIPSVQRDHPVPEVYLSRPSTDEGQDGRSSPGLDSFSEANIPSSPPARIFKDVQGEPLWPVIVIPAPDQSSECSLETPKRSSGDPERSSPFLPFAIDSLGLVADDAVSSVGRSSSYGDNVHSSPSCSLRPPNTFQTPADEKENTPTDPAKNLASANASAMMASVPKFHFPGAPLLLPPRNCETDIPRETSSMTRRRAASIAVPLQSYAYESPLSTPPKHSRISSSPQSKTPLGPRSEPARSMLKTAMALRRMNSETNNLGNRESQRYLHMGREASPLLPVLGDGDLECDDSASDLPDAESHAGTGADRDSLDSSDSGSDIDLSDLVARSTGMSADGDDMGPFGLQTIPSSSNSVWEDGEHFWNGRRQPTLVYSPRGLRLPVSMPRKAGTPSQLSRPARTDRRTGTPGSLYDSDGFLDDATLS